MEKYYKRCPRCDENKPDDAFHKRTASADGLDTYCRDCRNNEIKMPTTLESTSDEYVREGAEKILTALGYELYNANNPIHKQFDERIATKYRNR